MSEVNVEHVNEILDKYERGEELTLDEKLTINKHVYSGLNPLAIIAVSMIPVLAIAWILLG